MSTGKRRASVAAIGLAVGLVLIVPTPASPSKEFRYSVERRTTETIMHDSESSDEPSSMEHPMPEHAEAHLSRRLRYSAHGSGARTGS